MNIFYLDRNPKIAAEMHCDKHVVKMILESAQMLSTAHRVLDGDKFADDSGLYKMAHKNHPCSIWARANASTYKWLFDLYESLMVEYTYRYDKHHASSRLMTALRTAPINITQGEFVDPPRCMPDHCKIDGTVLSYQNYYMIEKSYFANWKRRVPPAWFIARSTDQKVQLAE